MIIKEKSNPIWLCTKEKYFRMHKNNQTACSTEVSLKSLQTLVTRTYQRRTQIKYENTPFSTKRNET